MVALGLVLAVMPLALWVAWSQPVFFVLLGVTAGAAAAFTALARFGGGGDEPPARVAPRVTVSDAFIAELHSHFPLTYHHRSLGDPRLKRKFAKLLALLNRTSG